MTNLVTMAYTGINTTPPTATNTKAKNNTDELAWAKLKAKPTKKAKAKVGRK